jgi:MarR family transcriptional regulator, transcriptional regulator for hemolysin
MNTKTETNPPEPAGRIMGKIGKLFLDKLQKELVHLDIERSFYPLLLIDAGNGKLTQQELANKLLTDKVQVVRIIDYLSVNGYVERIQNSSDRRKYELTITEKAKLIIPDIRKAFHNMGAIALNGLSEKQIEDLYMMLNRIENNLLSHQNLSAK